MANYPIPENPAFSTEVRKYATTDPAHADIFNQTTQRMYDNEMYLYKNKANISRIIRAVLVASEWTGNEAPYLNTFNLPDLGESKLYEVIVPTEATPEEIAAMQSGQIINGYNDATSITMKAWGSKPTVDINVYVIERGDF